MDRKLIAVATLALLSASSASAIPVTWTLSGVGFTNGSAATGSFVFDRDRLAFSSINISLTAGTYFPAQTFDAVARLSWTPYGVIFTTLPLSYNDTPACAASNDPSCGTHALKLDVYPEEMTDVGGVLSLTSGHLTHCGSAYCNSNGWSFAPDYFVTGGTISGVPVPIPPAVWLFGSALGLMGVMRRKLAS